MKSGATYSASTASAWTVSRLAAALATAFLAFTFSAGSAAAAPEGSRWGRDYFPNVPVVTHDGREVRFYDDLIEDKMVAINFIYTRCIDICPLSTARMAEIVDRLGDRIGKDFFVYSITLEPEFDTQEVLASYAEAFDAPPGWYFLTGAPEDIHHLRRKLGEKARVLEEHRHDLVLGDDTRGSWERSSMFSDVGVLAQRILDLDPAHRASPNFDVARSDALIGTTLRSDHPGQPCSPRPARLAIRSAPAFTLDQTSPTSPSAGALTG